jgi:ABC-2 type transport system ATP-binding protein
MSEMAMTADHLIVMGRGRVLADASVEEIVREWTSTTIRVRSPRIAELAGRLASDATALVAIDADTVTVTGVPMERIGQIAESYSIPLYELSSTAGSLEEAYLALTTDEVEYKTQEIS